MARAVLNLYVGLALLVPTVFCLDNLPIDQLFQVSFNPEDPGNCAVYETKIRSFALHAYSLALSGLSATYDADDGDGPANRLMNSFFVQPTSADIKTVRGKIQKVQDFLEDGMSTKPHLVCGDSWLERQTTGNQMYLIGGGQLATNQDGSPHYIYQDEKYNPLVAKKKMDNKYLYWSPVTKSYFFLPLYGDGSFGNGPCVGVTGDRPKFGETYQATDDHGILTYICERTFDLPNFRSIAAAPVPATQRNIMKDVRQLLNYIMPSVNVFYHELFHIALGHADSSTLLPNSKTEEYSVQFCTGKKPYANGNIFSKANALNNPQSYSFMSVAYDYTLRSPKVNGLPVEFYTVVCTYEDSNPNDAGD